MASKLRVFFALLSACSIHTANAEIQAYEESIARVETSPTEENFQDIGGHLRGVARYNRPPESSPYYRRIQKTILSIPGHAEFYAKPIRESYAAYRDQEHPEHLGSDNRYFDEMRYTMPTLRHLPSPETVKALGDMLWEEWEREPSPDSDVVPPRSLAKCAVTTITLLNIRDAPSPAIDPYAAPTVLAEWQAWYEQIKSGQRTFSFKGQAVEYRFKPDGTWETTPIANPPDDALQAPPTTSSAERTRKIPAAKAQPEELDNRTSRYLLIGLTALMTLAGAWFYLRRMKAGA